jgi:hypothetical protein
LAEECAGWHAGRRVWGPRWPEALRLRSLRSPITSPRVGLAASLGSLRALVQTPGRGLGETVAAVVARGCAGTLASHLRPTTVGARSGGRRTAVGCARAAQFNALLRRAHCLGAQAALGPRRGGARATLTCRRRAPSKCDRQCANALDRPAAQTDIRPQLPAFGPNCRAGQPRGETQWVGRSSCSMSARRPCAFI